MKYCLITKDDELIKDLTIRAYNSGNLYCTCIIKSTRTFYENLERIFKSDLIFVDSRLSDKYIFLIMKVFVVKSNAYTNASKILRVILTCDETKNNFNYMNIGFTLMMSIENLKNYPVGYLKDNILSYRNYLNEKDIFFDNRIYIANERTDLILKQMKIPTFLNGYKYLHYYLQHVNLTMSEIIGKNEDYIIDVISKRYKDSRHKIKRSIRSSIETSYFYCKDTSFKIIFVDDKMPTIAEFIAGISYFLFFYEKSQFFPVFSNGNSLLKC